MSTYIDGSINRIPVPTPDEHLGLFQKILLATATINHLASSIQSRKKDLEWMLTGMTFPEIRKTFEEPHQQCIQVLQQNLDKLKEVMEAFGNYCNETDCIVPIDEKITDPAFDILIQENDQVSCQKPFSIDPDELRRRFREAFQNRTPLEIDKSKL